MKKSREKLCFVKGDLLFLTKLEKFTNDFFGK